MYVNIEKLNDTIWRICERSYGIYITKYDFEILEIEVDKNHVHLLVESEPKVSPLMIVRTLKQQITIKLWNEFSDELCKYFWKERTFSTDGYFVSTIGEVSAETLRKYIQNQG